MSFYRIRMITHGSDFFDSTEQLLLHRNRYEILLQNSVATWGRNFFSMIEYHEIVAKHLDFVTSSQDYVFTSQKWPMGIRTLMCANLLIRNFFCSLSVRSLNPSLTILG